MRTGIGLFALGRWDLGHWEWEKWEWDKYFVTMTSRDITYFLGLRKVKKVFLKAPGSGSEINCFMQAPNGN